MLLDYSSTFDNKININIAPTCRKEHTREYYSENGCRSRRPVKLAKCWGSCGNSCCLPRKTKRRKVKNICISIRKICELFGF